MRSICLVRECTRLVPRVSALSPLPQALFSTSNATGLCRELLFNFLEYILLCGLSDSEQMFVVEPCWDQKAHVGVPPPIEPFSRLHMQVLANTQFRPMRSMNKKVQRRRQKKLHAKDLYWKFKRTKLQFSAKCRLHGHGSTRSCSTRAVYQTHKYMAISTPVREVLKYKGQTYY